MSEQAPDHDIELPLHIELETLLELRGAAGKKFETIFPAQAMRLKRLQKLQKKLKQKAKTRNQ